MSYIDYPYYNDVYKGSPIEDPDAFYRLSERATDLVDMITSYSVKGAVFENLNQLMQDNVKKAVANQVEFMLLNGGVTAIHGGSPSSVNIGNFSYQEGTNDQQSISPATIQYLKAVGLTYSGLNVL